MFKNNSIFKEVTLTDRTGVSIELYVFVEDDSKAPDTVRLADRRSWSINQDDIAERQCRT